MVAVLATIGAASSPAPPTTQVVVATNALAGGHTLASEDLRLVAVPDQYLPAEAVTDRGALVGRALVAPVTQGQVLTTVSVVRPRSGAEADGLVTTPLRLADTDVVGLLAVGDVVDVIAADPRTGASRVIAEQVRIVAIPQTPGGSGPLGTGTGDQSRLVLVAVPAKVATSLASAAVSMRLTVAWN